MVQKRDRLLFWTKKRGLEDILLGWDHPTGDVEYLLGLLWTRKPNAVLSNDNKVVR
jgi:hypothetical protein